MQQPCAAVVLRVSLRFSLSPCPRTWHKPGEHSSTELSLTVLQLSSADLWDQLPDSEPTHHATWMPLMPLCTPVRRCGPTEVIKDRIQCLLQLEAHNCCGWVTVEKIHMPIPDWHLSLSGGSWCLQRGMLKLQTRCSPEEMERVFCGGCGLISIPKGDRDDIPSAPLSSGQSSEPTRDISTYSLCHPVFQSPQVQPENEGRENLSPDRKII